MQMLQRRFEFKKVVNLPKNVNKQLFVSENCFLISEKRIQELEK